MARPDPLCYHCAVLPWLLGALGPTPPLSCEDMEGKKPRKGTKRGTEPLSLVQKELSSHYCKHSWFCSVTPSPASFRDNFIGLTP